MTSYRFEVGTTVLCNLGELGWKQGRIIAHNYREDPWPEGMFAPYQVVLEDDRSLIYVPEDDDRYCREPTAQDLHILGRTDALAAPTFDASAYALPTGGGPDNLRCEGALLHRSRVTAKVGVSAVTIVRGLGAMRSCTASITAAPQGTA